MIIFAGKTMHLTELGEGLVEWVLDYAGSSVNKLDTLTFKEVSEVLDRLEGTPYRGLLIRSEKPAFVVGADITEFTALFRQPKAVLLDWVRHGQAQLDRLAALPYPSVAAVNGAALGGGFELALAADYRVLADDGQVGLPEVSLGLCPGFGGTVRLSRLISADTALDWMLSGKPCKAQAALAAGAVDRVAAPAALRDDALSLLRTLASSDLHQGQRMHKHQPCKLNADLAERFASHFNPDYPAAKAISDALQQHAALPHDQALQVEASTFVELARGDAAQALVGLFLADQAIRKKARQAGRDAAPVTRAAVLGAGIMGGGIAYQSAVANVPIAMKDIRSEALTLGMQTASQQLDRQLKKGRISEADKQAVLARIQPSLQWPDVADAQVVVEAVVENLAIKAQVLAEAEAVIDPQAILASNTSTISIDQLAEGLARPENFCGMHFFNPVPLMPLVEVIRGRHTSEATVARTLAYALKLGKTPIVVRDCPGFLVNRVLFPYFNGFNRLLRDRVDFTRIDAVMERFGWPMGPAYLADVIGLDTMVHADRVLQQGFPERMGHDGEPVIEALLADGCLGQKNGRGFYEYGLDAGSGKRTRTPSEAAQEKIVAMATSPAKVTDDEIIERMMIPLCLEAVRCLEDGIVDSPAEVDMGLVLGLGFPRFRGGALRYLDSLGLAEFARRAARHARHGALYRLTDDFNERLQTGRSYC